MGGLGGAGLRVAERYPQWVRGGFGQLGTDDMQVGQVGGAVQAAAQPCGVGRVLRRRGAWEGTGWAQECLENSLRMKTREGIKYPSYNSRNYYDF